MKKLLLFMLVPATIFVSCGEQKPADAPKAAPKVVKPESAKLSEGQLKAVVAFVDGYYTLKDAMVATDEKKAKDAATAVSVRFKEMETSLIADSSKVPLVKANLDTIALKLTAITTITDPSCEQQRTAFVTLSDATFAMLKTLELKNAGIYRQYCPMAFNEKGGYWLSKDEEIKNPYLPKKMLNCGEIKDSL